MTNYTDVTYTCPRCQRPSPQRIWQSVNVGLNPELKESILDKSLVTFECPACHLCQEISYLLLYHDQEARYMAWLVPEGEPAGQVLSQAQLGSLGATLPGYRLRLVPSINRLIEKIIIFNFQMDDRVVEVLKHDYWSSSLESQGILYTELYLSNVGFDGHEPILEITALIPGFEPKRYYARGENGYFRAMKILHLNFQVPMEEETKWKTVDHTYWDLAASGRG